MSSVQYLKDVINVRLTTAAQEIFGAFKKCIHEYEVEIDRQRRLLDSVLKPEIKLDRIDSPQRHVFKENELLVVQKFCSRERNKNNKDQTPDKTQRAAQKKSFVHKLAISSVVPEQQHLQPLSNIRHESESQDQKGGKHFGSPRDAKSKPGHQGKSRVKIHKLATSKRSTTEFKEKMDPPCRLLDATTQKPEVKLDEIERPNQHFCTEKALTDWQIHHKQKNSAMDHESLQEENREKEAFTSLGAEQLVIKEEKDAFVLTPTCEKYENSKDQTLDLNPNETPTAAKKRSVVNKQVISIVGAPNSDLHLANNSHVAESQNQTDETCEQDLPFDPKSQIIKNTHDKPYICSTCGRNFKKVGYLRVHRRTHTAEKRFVCPKCGENFRARHLLKVHMKKVKCEKSNNLKYICEICKHNFGSIYYLKIHMRIHTGERPYICETCGKAFRDNGTLTVHKRVHTGEKPFSCELCKKNFTRKFNLNIHMRTHANDNPYICGTCGKHLSDNHSLSLHVRTHTDEKGRTSERTRQREELTVDRRESQTAETAFLCKICAKNFRSRYFLKIHMRIHTGEVS